MEVGDGCPEFYFIQMGFHVVEDSGFDNHLAIL